MILTKIIKITICSKNIHHYKLLGYENLKMSQKLIVPIEYLVKGSHLKIEVECDICHKTKKLAYYAYNANINNCNYYACCRKCASKKVKNTNLKKHGDENYNNREKCRETTLKNHGVEHAHQLEKFRIKAKQTNLTRHGNENYNNPEKNKKTCLEKYGVEYIFQNEEVIKKSKKTRLEIYGNENYKNDEKIKKTNLEKYGVECTFQSNESKEKIKQTNLKKYGVVHPLKSEKIKNKIKLTNLEKYGETSYAKTNECKEKTKQSNLKKYGVEYVSQFPEIFMKQQKSGFKLHFHENTKLYYRGSYEKDFLDFCFNNKIIVKQGKRIKYFFENKDHYYFSDYYIELKNLIIEIKSLWTYNKYLDKNLIKQQTTIKNGYNYLFIIDKNYKEFQKYFIIKNNQLQNLTFLYKFH